MPVSGEISRRQCIPIVYTRGTHHEVGYDVGRTFSGLIQNYLNSSRWLNDDLIPAYETAAGRKAYELTLRSVKGNFPQYISELEGTAEGAKVPFHKLFLLHMDRIVTFAAGKEEDPQPVGCSSVCMNQIDQQVLGHTEDALDELLNNYYLVSAHIIAENPQGRWGVKEERFTSLCYAGHLPGYTMSYNHHGLVFSINTLFCKQVFPGKTPRHILTRALLSADDFEQAQKILRDSGCGAGDGCSINMTFLNQGGDRLFHNIEMAPANEEKESQLNVLTGSPGENLIHCNSYLRMNVGELNLAQFSNSRLQALNGYPTALKKDDVINMLGDKSGKPTPVFQAFESDRCVTTLAVGIFDCIEKTWAIYADNPKSTEPLVVLPLSIKKTSCEDKS